MSHLSSNSSKNGVKVFQESAEHCAFWDEIEAPMWVDLNLECKSAYEDKDCEWFTISHPFHQCSSRELISLFSGSNEGCSKLDIGIMGPSSPKIPSSVSKSRGQRYKSREWEKEKHKAVLSKRHPVKNLSSKRSWLNFGSDKAVKDKTCIGKVNEHNDLKSGVDGEGSLSDTAGAGCSSSVSSFGDMKNHTNFVSSTVVDSNPRSTVTSEVSGVEQQKSLEVSSQVLGHTSGLLSSLRVTLRKSCLTRQAARVEVNRGRQSEGRKSSCSKSSVGSSSYPGSDGKNLTARLSKDRTPESRNVMRVSHTSNEKVNVANVSKAQNSNSNFEGESFTSLHTSQGTKEAEVRNQNLCPKVLVPQRVNEHISATTVAKAKGLKAAVCHKRSAQDGKENVGRMTVVQQSSSNCNHLTMVTKASERTRALNSAGTVGGFKVNPDGRTALSQTLCTLEKAAKGIVQARTITKRRGLQKSGMEKVFAPKDNIGGRIREKICANTTGKVYLR